jgi:hypothetical protein
MFWIGFDQVWTRGGDALTRSYMQGYERDKHGYVFDHYLTVDHLGAGRPAESGVHYSVRTIHVYSTMAPIEVIDARVPPIDLKPIMVSCGKRPGHCHRAALPSDTSPARSPAYQRQDPLPTTHRCPDRTRPPPRQTWWRTLGVAHSAGGDFLIFRVLDRNVTAHSFYCLLDRQFRHVSGCGLHSRVAASAMMTAVMTALTTTFLGICLQGLQVGAYEKFMSIPSCCCVISPSKPGYTVLFVAKCYNLPSSVQQTYVCRASGIS